MKIALCIAAGIVVCLHALASFAQLRSGKENAWMMIAGAAVAAAGIVLCLCGGSMDWVFALAGFLLIACAAIQNGQKKQDVHIRHHIIRISLFVALTLGFCIW